MGWAGGFLGGGLMNIMLDLPGLLTGNGNTSLGAVWGWGG